MSVTDWLASPVAALLAISAALQTPPTPQRATQVMAATRPLAAVANATPGTTEITVRWRAVSQPGANAGALAAAPAAANTFEVVARRLTPSEMVIERAPELSADQLVVVAVNAAGIELGWQLCKDPRIVRSEGPTASGQLGGQTLYRTDAEFIIATPAGVTPAQFRIYQPQWNGTEFLLTLLGVINVAQ